MERDRLKTAICANFGIDVPIFGFAHSVAAAAAISREGGLGVYGATRDTPGEIRERLAQMRALAGDRPIGVDLVLPHGMPERDDREAIEAALAPEHRAFVAGLYEKFQVPPASGPGMRSRFVRSNEMAAAQIEAVLKSDVDVFACGIGAPPEAIERATQASGRSRSSARRSMRARHCGAASISWWHKDMTRGRIPGRSARSP